MLLRYISSRLQALTRASTALIAVPHHPQGGGPLAVLSTVSAPSSRQVHCPTHRRCRWTVPRHPHPPPRGTRAGARCTTSATAPRCHQRSTAPTHAHQLGRHIYLLRKRNVHMPPMCTSSGLLLHKTLPVVRSNTPDTMTVLNQTRTHPPGAAAKYPVQGTNTWHAASRVLLYPPQVSQQRPHPSSLARPAQTPGRAEQQAPRAKQYPSLQLFQTSSTMSVLEAAELA